MDSAAILERETGVAMNARALRAWYKDVAWAQGSTRWWKSPVVQERAERRALEDAG